MKTPSENKDPENETSRWLASISEPQSLQPFKDHENETYGPWVATRGSHTLTLPPEFRMGVYLVTNELYLLFVKAAGYEKDAFWKCTPPGARDNFLCQDRKTKGPLTWPSKEGCLRGNENHPVTGICYYEAQAFCQWLNDTYRQEGWQWCLPTEDMWELTARSATGLKYPWGNDFRANHCNSTEAGIGTTTPVDKFGQGKSKYGCYDMAGNVWEFTREMQEHWYCVLRGGSYRNSQNVVKSYLRLWGVPREHRPPDFGFRFALEPK